MGRNLRIDATLKGVNTKSESTVPEWKRGHYSLLFAGGGGNATLLYLNRDKKVRKPGRSAAWLRPVGSRPSPAPLCRCCSDSAGLCRLEGSLPLDSS